MLINRTVENDCHAGAYTIHRMKLGPEELSLGRKLSETAVSPSLRSFLSFVKPE